jgi:hypothetical protein
VITQLVVPALLVANGLAAGVLLWSAVAGVPFMLIMPAQRYVQAQQFWGKRSEPLQPTCMALTALADVTLALTVGNGPARWLFTLGAVVALSVITVSLTRNVPIKRWVMSLDARALPEDFEQRDPRRTWAAWNLTRTVLAVLALAANAAAVGFLL